MLIILTLEGAKKFKIRRNRSILTGFTVYPEYELKIDLKLEENQHDNWSNILACQISDSHSHERLWRGSNGDRIRVYHRDFYMFQLWKYIIFSVSP